MKSDDDVRDVGKVGLVRENAADWWSEAATMARAHVVTFVKFFIVMVFVTLSLISIY